MLNATRDLEENLNSIEDYMLKAFPQCRCRLDLFSLIDHNNQTKYMYMIQTLFKASRECSYDEQSAQQILISLAVNGCTDSDMIKYLANNTEQIVTMEALNKFENFVKSQDAKFTSSNAYPNYMGLGTKTADVKIGKFGTGQGKAAVKKREEGG